MEKKYIYTVRTQFTLLLLTLSETVQMRALCIHLYIKTIDASIGYDAERDTGKFRGSTPRTRVGAKKYNENVSFANARGGSPSIYLSLCVSPRRKYIFIIPVVFEHA